MTTKREINTTAGTLLTFGSGSRMWLVTGVTRPRGADAEILARRSTAASVTHAESQQAALVAQSRVDSGGEGGKLALNVPHESACVSVCVWRVWRGAGWRV